MPSRRTILAGTAAMLASPLAQPAAANEPLRFGIVADPQYADAEPNLAMNRHYRNSLVKLRQAVETFNGADLSFVATLGDLIDRHRASYEAIRPVYAGLRHPHRAVLGNHDFEVGPENLHAMPGLAGLSRAYYDFAAGAFRFVVLDGNDVSLFAPPPGDPRWQIATDRLGALRAANAVNAKPWNGSLGEAQFAWLSQTLAAAQADGERVIVLNHYPLFPENPHNLWDAPRLVRLLTGQPHVVAYFCGHNHAGNHGVADGLHFVNFCGMVDTPDTNAFAIVEIAGTQMTIQGFGREPSRTLRLRG